MADATPLQGSCLCGACTFTATPAGDAGVCHCAMCNKWSGGMFLNVYCADTVVFGEAAPLASYKASTWGERVFCSACGSSLMWQTQDGAHQSVSIQMFDDANQFAVKTQIFIDKKPCGYALAGETANMTEAEVFAKYAPEGQS